MKQRKSVRNTLLSLSLVAVAAIMSGCATPATFEGMVPGDYDTAHKHANSVSVQVSGGQETNAAWKSQISDEAFAKALVEAITKSQTFSQVVQGKGGNYQLLVSIIGMQQPTFGMDMTVKMEAGWTLKNAATGQVVWQESIKSQHTATPGDAFVGTTRLRLANEGAAKNNIKQGLAKISRLNL